MDRDSVHLQGNVPRLVAEIQHRFARRDEQRYIRFVPGEKR